MTNRITIVCIMSFSIMTLRVITIRMKTYCIMPIGITTSSMLTISKQALNNA